MVWVAHCSTAPDCTRDAAPIAWMAICLATISDGATISRETEITPIAAARVGLRICRLSQPYGRPVLTARATAPVIAGTNGAAIAIHRHTAPSVRRNTT